MDIVFDGDLEYLAFHEPERGEVQLVTVGASGVGIGAELGDVAYLGVDENDAFAQLALRGPMAHAPLLGGPSDRELESEAGPPEAELAEADWPEDGSVTWRIDGSTLTVVVEGARRSQWARIGRTPVYVALDLSVDGAAYVAALVHRAVTSDPNFTRFQATLQRL
jgi:hypothetical protein